MQTVITLVTGNAGKLQELQKLAAGTGLNFTARSLELHEVQSLDLREIVTHKLHQAYDKVQTPVIVEDVSAALSSLNGLPGPFIKFFNMQLGQDALYKLLQDADETVTVICLAGYYDGKQLLFGEGVLTGKVVAPRGGNGFGFDPVVQPDEQPSPDGPPRTMAEMTAEEKNMVSHRSKAFRDLVTKLT